MVNDGNFMYYSGMNTWSDTTGLKVHSCGPGRHEAGWSWETDGSVRYAPFSFLLISEGRIKVEFPEDKPLTAGAGDFILLRWDTPRREINIGTGTLVAAWCSFIPGEQKLLRAETAQLRHLSDPSFAYSCMQRLIDAHVLGKPYQASAYLAPILIEFAQGHSKRRKKQDSWQQRIRQVCRRIQAQPEADWSIPQLAGEHHCDPDHFARVFRRIIGEAPGRYVIRCRIERARDLLLHSNESVSSIAELLRYCDAYAFSKQFKQHTGQSPSTFRALE